MVRGRVAGEGRYMRRVGVEGSGGVRLSGVWEVRSDGVVEVGEGYSDRGREKERWRRS